MATTRWMTSGRPLTRRSMLQAIAVGAGVALCPATGLSATTGPAWRSAARLPINTQELYPVVHRGRLFVAGGIAARVGVPWFSDRVFSYDPVVDSWHEVAAMPEARHHAAMVSVSDRLFVVGGFHGEMGAVWQMQDSVIEWSETRWTVFDRMPVPQAEGVLATATTGGVAHLVSGQSPRGTANEARRDHTEVVAHWRWTPADRHWESAAPIPTARNSATGGWVGRQLVVTGGRTSRGNLAVTEIYDEDEDRWRVAAPMPLPQAGTASVVVDDQLLVFGGEIFTPEAKVFPNAWRYSVAQDKWFALPDLPTPRHGLGAGVIDGNVYVIGGATSPGGRGTTDHNEVLSGIT